MDPRTKNLEGKIIGEWTVINYAGIIKDNAHWNCRCSCGFEKPVKAQYLLGGVSRKCQTCAIPKRANITGMIPDYYWRHIKKNAAKRNITISISKEECYNILVAQNYKCAISGIDIRLSTSSAEHTEGKTTASIDRIDSLKPYEKGNVQWVHKDVNMMKHVFSMDYFLGLCDNIISYQKLRGDQQ